MKNALTRFSVSDQFFGRYKTLMRDVVLPYQEKILKDQIPGAEPSNAIRNFELAAQVAGMGTCDGEFQGMIFQDSDVAKWLEAAAYSMVCFPDKELESRCDELIDLIGRAQMSDGYINTYFTVKAPEKRWTNLEEAHELYCAGHLIEAGVAFADCLEKTKLLDIVCKFANHIYTRFIVEGHRGYPGHPEIELALMRLYRRTRNRQYLQLARHFVDVRGVDSEFFIWESKQHDWTVWGNRPEDKQYLQCHLPVREQKDATGHAVRAVYLYTGMADIAREIGDEYLSAACRALWHSITQKRMYVTGAIGSAYEGESFTRDYHLPNDTAYAETCASIGLIFFAKKMLDLDKNSMYSNIMERALYNVVLGSMDLTGDKYFYVNPLEVIPGISGEAVTHRHARPARSQWFPCACCPPNVMRLLTSIGEYAWSIERRTVFSHLYIGGVLDLSDVCAGRLRIRTAYPYGGTVEYRFEPNLLQMDMTLAVRLPDWSQTTEILRNGRKLSYESKDGYAYIEGPFFAEDNLVLRLDMSAKKIYAGSDVYSTHRKVAFSRGPLIYCAEGHDNGQDLLGKCVDAKAAPVDCGYNDDKLCGIVELVIDGFQRQPADELYTYSPPQYTPQKLRLIPYYAWANRGISQMRVWMPEVGC